ncbi:response regulator [Mesoterricola sediminis]|uniref:response regulator n=1 Tax=Mesoterricola sediminis TaxID=2927980 RepID=UPI001FAF50F6|nr:response regulator [Mesoterricola sediminis]
MPPPIIAPHLPPQRLLLVDDDLVLLETLQELLSAEGFEVTAVSSGEEADELIREAQPPFDLVLTDLVMPGRTGMDVLNAALAHNPSCTVLVLSGYGTVREATEAMDRGAYGMVNKPLQLEAFRQTLRRIVERTHLMRERDQLRIRVAELEERIGRLEAIQGRMEMLAQRMGPNTPEAGHLQVLKALRARGILDEAHFESARKALLAGLP